MNYAWIIIAIVILFIIGGLLVLKDSARKFKLTDEQLENIKKRNKELDEEERKEQ